MYFLLPIGAVLRVTLLFGRIRTLATACIPLTPNVFLTPSSDGICFPETHPANYSSASSVDSGMLAGIKAQHAWSVYPVHLFIHQSREGEPSALKDSSNTKTTSIYIMAGWASVEAHEKLMASPESKEIMRSFGEANLLSLGGLAHLDIDFTKLSFEECSHIIWRKRGVNDTLSWEDTPGQDIDKSGSEGKLKARRIWSYRGRAIDEGVEDEYELLGFSDGELPEVGEEYKILRKWDIEALSGMA